MWSVEKEKLESEIKSLQENLKQADEDMKSFRDNVRKQFEERKQKVKVTIERLKQGFEESLREKDEQHERILSDVVEEKERGK